MDTNASAAFAVKSSFSRIYHKKVFGKSVSVDLNRMLIHLWSEHHSRLENFYLKSEVAIYSSSSAPWH